MTKNEIRLRLKEQRDKITSAEQNKLDKEISNRLFQTKAYQNCKMIFTYLSFRSEVDTRAIIQKSLLDGKDVFLPRVEDKNMDFYQIRNLEGMIISKFGVSEPPKEVINRYNKTQDYPVKQNLMLLPGLAFDSKGNRIGYGAGYYDRYLSEFSLTHFYKIGLAYDFQVIENIPTDEFDIKADAILTPDGLINCRL